MKKKSVLPADIRVIGSIDEEAYKAFCDAVLSFEKKKAKVVTVEIVSEGGSAAIAMAFIARMRLSPLAFITVGNGRVASSATLILAAGHNRLVTKETLILVHEDQNIFYNDRTYNTTAIERFARNARKNEDLWNRTMAKLCCGVTSAESFAKLHAKGDTELTPTQALNLGMIDEII